MSLYKIRWAFVACFLCLFSSGCSDVSNFENEIISVKALADNEEKLIGKKVIVEGYLRHDFSVKGDPGIGLRLYERSDDAETSVKTALSFELTETALKAEEKIGEKVVISGIFSGQSHGVTRISYANIVELER